MAESDSLQKPRPRTFLSHASADAEVAHRVCAILETAGVECWMAPRDVPPGEPYAGAIVEAINGCDRLLLFLSRDAAASPHVLREVERAASKGRPILALRLEDVVLPPTLEYFLSANQWLDAPGGRIDDILPTLIATLRAPGDSRTPAPPAFAGAVPAVTRRRPRGWLVLAGAMVLLLAVFALRLISHSPAARAVVVPAEPHAATTPARPGASVAVLPFADLSKNKDQEYFSDGLSEELIDVLGRIPGLRVPARTSSFYFKGKQATTADIAKTLGVTHLLEGSVRKSGNALRISVELIRTDTDSRIWSQTYDRPLADVFKVQEEIADAVSSALQLTLLRGSQAQAQPTENTQAYDLYLTALAAQRRGDRASALSALASLKHVVALDPKFAAAWVALAVLRVSNYVVFEIGPLKAAREDALDAADRAIALAPDLASAHVARARVLLFLDWNLDGANTELQTALRLAPGDTMALRSDATISLVRGHFDEALARLREAAVLDPLSPWVYYNESFALLGLHRLPDAEAAIRRAIDVAPASAQFHAVLATLLAYMGRHGEALDELAREPDPMFRETRLPWLLYQMGRRSEGDQALAVAERKYSSEAADFIASAYAARGDLEHAIEWANRAVAIRGGGVFYYQADPVWQPFLQDPRFVAFWTRAGLSKGN